MKNSLIYIVFLFVMSACAGSKSEPGVCLVTGTAETRYGVKAEPLDKIYLFKVTKGQKEVVTMSPIVNKCFTLSFYPEEEGFFVLGYRQNDATDDYLFYFKPGDCLQVAMTHSSYELIGENTPENREMERWHHFVYPLEEMAFYRDKCTYVEFFPLLGEKWEAYQQYESWRGKNRVFDQKFRNMQELSIHHYALHSLYSLRADHPDASDMTAFYRDVDVERLTKTCDFLGYPYGMMLLTRIHQVPLFLAETEEEKNAVYVADLAKRLELALPRLHNAELKGEWILQEALTFIREYGALREIEKRFGGYFVDDSQRKRLRDRIIQTATNEPGQDYFDFTFEDKDGKRVSLSDFMGKVVYVDVWATWCSPCIQEIPAMQELGKRYHGKEVVFMSVSIDKPKDRERWEKMLVEKEMGGVQLIAGDDAGDIMDPYRIARIPRFMLFSREGKIIRTNAPRPSSPEITALLDEWIGK